MKKNVKYVCIVLVICSIIMYVVFVRKHGKFKVLCKDQCIPTLNYTTVRKIPRVLYKTGPSEYNDLNQNVKNLFHEIESDNPGYTIQYFSDRECREFIQKHFDDDVLDAFDRLIPGAFKADLFRYCIMYENGGVYGDLTQQYLFPLHQVIHENDNLVLVRDLYNDTGSQGIQIAFMAAVPKLEVYKLAIEKIVENVKNQFYGISYLQVTGPALFRECVEKLGGVDALKIRMELEQYNSKYYTYIGEREPIVNTKLVNHDKTIKKNKNTSYANLWKNKNIYKVK